MKCKGCGAQLNLTMSNCPACGVEVPLGRLTGLLGIVCRHCDAYNEPVAVTCISCGQSLRAAPAPRQSQPPPASPVRASPVSPPPAAAPAPPRPAPVPPPGPVPILLTQAVSEDFLKAPIPRSFPKLAAAGKAAAVEPAPSPIPLVPTCPNCGQEAGTGQTCGYCGQPIGVRGTQVMTPPPQKKEPALAADQARQSHGKLVLERGEGHDGAAFQLGPEDVMAGRSAGAVAFPSDPCLAPHHATFFYRNGALHVRDEGGANGLFLRLRTDRAPLKPGNLFSVGDRLLRFAGVLPPPPPPSPDGTLRFGSPRPQVTSILIEEWIEGGSGGRVFLGGGPTVSIGRAGCAINLGDDPFVSQAHAEISLDSDGGAAIRDLGSSNGTFLQIPSRSEIELQNGDMIRMGREVLRVALGG